MKIARPSLSDKALERLQRDAFKYFLKETNLANGLVRDNTRKGAHASIAPSDSRLRPIQLGWSAHSSRAPKRGSVRSRRSGSFGTVPRELAPEIVLPTINCFDDKFPELTSKYGFKCSYNPTFADGSGRGWRSKGYYGLDQGPTLLMIENYRSGFLWRLMRHCAYIVTGLRRAGFVNGWLGGDSVDHS